MMNHEDWPSPAEAAQDMIDAVTSIHEHFKVISSKNGEVTFYTNRDLGDEVLDECWSRCDHLVVKVWRSPDCKQVVGKAVLDPDLQQRSNLGW